MTDATRRWGNGPGPITPDGCAVAVYTTLPPTGEPEIVHASIPAGATILELGSGAGRVTHELIALGHEVTAVDESAEMLAHVKGAVAHHGNIADLRLTERFDAVVLASFLVNTYDPELRGAMLATCRSHVKPGGCVLVQRHLPSYFAETRADFDGLSIETRDVSHPEPGVVAATLEYRLGDRTWTHTFQERFLDEEDLAECFGKAGLEVESYLNADRTWVRARVA